MSTTTDGSTDAIGARDWLVQYLAERVAAQTRYQEVPLSTFETGRALLAADARKQLDVLIAAYAERSSLDKECGWETEKALSHVRKALLRKKLPLTTHDVERLAGCMGKRTNHYDGVEPQLLKLIEQYAQSHELSAESLKMLRRCRKKLEEFHPHTALRKCMARLDALVGSPAGMPIVAGEAWSDAALADLESLESEQRTAWSAIFAHCRTATAGTPSKAWLAESRRLVEALSADVFRTAMIKWFPLVDRPRTQPLEHQHRWAPDPNLLLSDLHADILKGLAWCCGQFEDRDIARALTALAMSAYKKVPGIGPRAVRVGNAAVWALGNMPGLDAVGQLALLKVKIKFGTAQKGIAKALAAAGEREGLPAEELEEMAVPAYGLDEVGVRQEQLGDFTARLTVTGTATTQLTWLKPDGKPQKSVPSAVSKDHADELKELKAAAKDIQKMLPAQRDRLDNLYLEQKSWPFDVWCERYLDHPLVGTLARRLIWRFTTGKKTADGIWLDGRLVGHDGAPLQELEEKTTVELWHPIGRPLDDVLGWRNWLEEHQIRQPFKQAHREVYLLTDAERNTQVYSNRYAAHILKQHQFNALCGVRGWKNTLRLMVDDSYPPAMRLLPKWNLRAEFWVEGAGDEYGTDTNEAGTFLYLATDQVRFYPLEAPERYAHASGGGYATYFAAGVDNPLPLADVPPLVFSEIMRDVDLFVGVASVGNDPNWSDGGPEGRYRDYWAGYSFGELTATAQTRKAVLERLIPRLKIADRCSFNERFLVVRGDLRTYKIHLGSGNILMSPNDQYLCIVPKQSRDSAGDKLFLPFEGDGVLSIVLSKALLLADDRKITDSTIVRQIKS
jgi:hypothetical protein